LSKLSRTIICACIILGPALWFGQQGKTIEMALALLAGFTTAIIINIDQIKRYKAGNVEAELRDEIKKTVEEANATVKTFNEAIIPLIEYTLTEIGAGEPTVDKNPLFKYKVKCNLAALVKKLKIENASINNAFASINNVFLEYHLRILSRKIMESASASPFVGSNILLREIDDYCSNIQKNNDQSKGARLKKIMEPYKGALSKETKEAVEDFLHYCTKGELRRPGEFETDVYQVASSEA
jgi:hypothetical protein